MAHWAELDDDNVVQRVVYTTELYHPATEDQTSEEVQAGWVVATYGGSWQRTYYATEGHTYAGLGYTWDATAGDFIPPTVAAAPAEGPDLVNDALVNSELYPPGG